MLPSTAAVTALPNDKRQSGLYLGKNLSFWARHSRSKVFPMLVLHNDVLNVVVPVEWSGGWLQIAGALGT